LDVAYQSVHHLIAWEGLAAAAMLLFQAGVSHLPSLNHGFKGFWQQKGWSDDDEIKTTSQIRVPGNRARVSNREVLLGGVAFSGVKGISEVEISPDDGNTWLLADSLGPLSPYTWVLWTTEWGHPLILGRSSC
jgi:hypothetical protein